MLGVELLELRLEHFDEDVRIRVIYGTGHVLGDLTEVGVPQSGQMNHRWHLYPGRLIKSPHSCHNPGSFASNSLDDVRDVADKGLELGLVHPFVDQQFPKLVVGELHSSPLSSIVFHAHPYSDAVPSPSSKTVRLSTVAWVAAVYDRCLSKATSTCFPYRSLSTYSSTIFSTGS